jgi:beta-RFAP synthase
MTRIEAPSRLHFGLLSLPVASQTCWPDPDGQPGLPIRAFGGVGLMTDRPGVVVSAEPDREWSSDGVHAERALDFAKTFVAGVPEKERCRFRIRVERCPPEHVGLGVGTSLGLSVAKVLACELGHGDMDAVELAKRIGRGKRSAVGIHGFQHGGFIVEGGKLPDEPIAPLICRCAFPEDWRVLLLLPNQSSDWHGDRERDALANLRIGNDTDMLCRIVLTGLLPALQRQDFAGFSRALSEFNLRAGRAFEREQEGRYATRTIQSVLGVLRDGGVLGAGQSSWGPAIWALASDPDRSEELRRTLTNRNECSGYQIWECKAARHGAGQTP